MLFSSITFIYYFLPLTAAVYFLSLAGTNSGLLPFRGAARFQVKGRCALKLPNMALLLCSLVFYGWGEPRYVLLMGVSILSCYGFGLLIEKHREGKAGRALCFLSVAVSLGFLLYFKYADFFLANLGALTGWQVPLLHVSLPIGISFYTFQIISYTVDVYRGEKAQGSLADLAVYVAMFPQLVAGPIVRYSDIAGSLSKREHSWRLAAEGIRRFILGLAKKILLANQLGELCGAFRASQDQSVLFYWLYGIAFALHCYFDFSGYSDMAIGLGRVFGFSFPENFNYPFISASITQFWRRWHISLGTWFRDYVYIPLGGNRRGKGRQLFNILAVWALTGLWHGAAWNFVLWGLLFAVLLVAEKLWLLKYLEKSRVLSRVYVLFFVVASFMVFNGQDLAQAFSDLCGLFAFGRLPLTSVEALYCLRSYGIVLLLALLGATPLVKYGAAAIARKKAGARFLNGAEPAMLLALLLVMTAYLVDGSFNPFLYFRF